MNQQTLFATEEPPAPEAPPIIQHVLCACGRMEPLADGLVRFDADEGRGEPVDYWQCGSCFHSVNNRATMNVFGITGIQRIKTTPERIRAAKVQRRWNARKLRRARR